jgi:hypothetical protein
MESDSARQCGQWLKPGGAAASGNRDINAGLADPKLKAGLADLGGMVHAGTADRRRNREVGKGGQILGCEAGLILEPARFSKKLMRWPHLIAIVPHSVVISLQ